MARGYNDTGIADLLSAAGVPKGSFYHHFKSKEAFGLAVIDNYGTGATAELEATLADTAYRPLERVRRFFEAVFSEFEGHGCRLGCLLGNKSRSHEKAMAMGAMMPHAKSPKRA